MFLSHNSAQLYTVEFGSGPRTILAHGGWTGSWELWSGPFHYLSKTWRTVAYDHRGSGATIAPVESISIETMVDDLFAVMDSVEIDQCVLAAESAGAIVAATAVLQEPHRFEGLVLVDALLHKENDESDAVFIQGLKTDFPKAIGHFADMCVLETEQNCMEVRSWGRKILARASPEASVRLIECTHGVDLRESLVQIQIPTLIFHGSKDSLVPLADSEYIASQIRGSQLHILEGAGHVPTMTRPCEIAQKINQYFSK